MADASINSYWCMSSKISVHAPTLEGLVETRLEMGEDPRRYAIYASDEPSLSAVGWVAGLHGPWRHLEVSPSAVEGALRDLLGDRWEIELVHTLLRGGE